MSLIIRFHSVAATLAALMGSGFVSPARAEITAMPVPGKSYQIVSKLSGKCVDISTHTLLHGTQLQQSDCSSSPSQKFHLEDAGQNSSFWVTQQTNQFVQLSEQSSLNGIPIVAYPASAGDTPRMILTPSHEATFTIQFVSSGKCLDIEGPTFDAGGKLHQWQCLGKTSQDWQFVEQKGGLGDRAWSLNRTSLITDSLNRLFRQTITDSGLILTSVDEASGQDNWSVDLPANAILYPGCNDKTHFYVFGDGKLQAFDPIHGQNLWTFDSGDTNTILTCSAEWKSFYLSSNLPDGNLLKVLRDNGEKVWSQKIPGYAAILGVQQENIFISSYQGNAVTLFNVAGGSGAIQWTKPFSSQEYLTIQNDAYVFLQDDKTITKINPHDGRAEWAYTAHESATGLFLDWNAGNAIYAREGNSLRSLSPQDGRILWSIETPKASDSTQAALVTLRDGKILTSTYDSAGSTNRAVLYDRDGKVLWTTSIAGGFLSPAVDKSTHLFFRSDRLLVSLNPKTGDVRWKFTHEQTPDRSQIYNFETYGSDVFVTYGGTPARYPPMGIVRLDAMTGALQWDVWTGESTTLIGVADDLLLTNRVMGTGVVSYKL